MEIIVDAVIENIVTVTTYVNRALESMGVDRRKCTQIDIALDELLSNVCHYAYGEEVGKMRITVEESADADAVRIVIEDKGIPFDPLAREDPDVTLSLDERSIGGLGIFMVKKIMDDVTYEHVDGRNVITVHKKK